MVIANGRQGKKLMCRRKKNSGVAACNKKDALLSEVLQSITEELCERVITEETIRGQIELVEEMTPQALDDERKRKQGITVRLGEIQREQNNILDFAKQNGAQKPLVADRLMRELEDLMEEEERLKADSFTLSEETREQEAFLTNPDEVTKTALELSTYLHSEDKTAIREFLRFFIREVELFEDGFRRLEYSLPLPKTDASGNTAESKRHFLGHNILLEHGGPAPQRVYLDCPNSPATAGIHRVTASTKPRAKTTQAKHLLSSPGSTPTRA